MEKSENMEVLNEINEIIRDDNINYMSNNKDDEGFNIISFSKDLNTGFLADIFKRDHNNKFIYNGSNLYYYNNTYWKKDDKLNEINNFIDTIFFKSMIKQINKYNEYCMGNLKGKEYKEFLDNSYVIYKSIGKLRNVNYRKDLIKDIQHKLYNDDIKFDEIPHLFAFNNKIFDLKQNKFIDPKPEYYISMTTGYNYIEENNKDHKIMELEAVIEQILYTESHKKLYLTLMATGLIGETLDKFICVSGSGGNGKSVLSEAIQYMMGSYCYIMPNDVLINTKMGGPSPEKANANNKRLIITREPPAKDNKNNNMLLNCSVIKELTGGSEINARLCNSNDTKILMKCTLMIECNKKLLLSECTQAMLRRLIDIPFKSSFIENYQYNELNKNGLLNTESTFIKNIY
jgi:phage/plasmid-associated DNA primase